MNKVIMLPERLSQTIKGFNVPANQYFIGSIGAYRKRLMLKTYHEIVLAEAPNTTWEHAVPIDDYLPVDVEIHVKETK